VTVAVPFPAVVRLVAVVLAALALCVPAHAAAPAVQARAYVVQSSVDGHTLAARQATTPRAMASLTKLMTALVALQHVSLDDVVTVPAAAASVGESSIELRAGERVPVRDLLIGTLVPSANDAATALAVAAAGSVPRFVTLMNREARRLGLDGTHYENPHGLDQPGHVSTARDVAVLLREALRNPVIRRYAGMQRATLSDGRVVESTDNLLGRVGGIVGGKTGHTALAGWSQAAFARRGGVGVTAVVLGSPSEAQRDADLAALLRFGLESYRMSKVVDPTRTYATIPVGWGRPPVRAVAPRAILRPASTHRPLVERVVVPAVATLPVVAGQRLGTLVVTDGSRVVARSALVAAGRRRTPGVPAKAWWVARRTIHHLGEALP
jgi:serine-type D-Ala-D-Ala carboxypeptidase (penicillin-binding protein 5/6)